MTDDERVAAFAAGRLPPGRFGHREHLHLAWTCITRLGPARAERLLANGLRRLAVRAGQPGKFDAALTRAWVDVIARAQEAVRAGSFEQFVAARRDLLDPAAVAAGEPAKQAGPGQPETAQPERR